MFPNMHQMESRGCTIQLGKQSSRFPRYRCRAETSRVESSRTEWWRGEAAKRVARYLLVSLNNGEYARINGVWLSNAAALRVAGRRTEGYRWLDEQCSRRSRYNGDHNQAVDV